MIRMIIKNITQLSFQFLHKAHLKQKRKTLKRSYEPVIQSVFSFKYKNFFMKTDKSTSLHCCRVSDEKNICFFLCQYCL